jgi:hypothetical protein
MQLEVADFETACNAFLSDSPLLIPSLEDAKPNGVISIKGDGKQVYDCNQESCETSNALLASVEL